MINVDIIHYIHVYKVMNIVAVYQSKAVIYILCGFNFKLERYDELICLRSILCIMICL